MCRLSSEVFVAAGGSSALATIATFFKVHWDAVRDRKAFKSAKDRERQNNAQSSEIQNVDQLD